MAGKNKTQAVTRTILTHSLAVTDSKYATRKILNESEPNQSSIMLIGSHKSNVLGQGPEP